MGAFDRMDGEGVVSASGVGVGMFACGSQATATSRKLAAMCAIRRIFGHPSFGLARDRPRPSLGAPPADAVDVESRFLRGPSGSPGRYFGNAWHPATGMTRGNERPKGRVARTRPFL